MKSSYLLFFPHSDDIENSLSIGYTFLNYSTSKYWNNLILTVIEHRLRKITEPCNGSGESGKNIVIYKGTL